MDLAQHPNFGTGWPSALGGTLRPGMVLGRYELLAPVAIGGMACVWAARLSGYRGFSKLVALKTVLPHLAAYQDFENMLLDEARIAADAHHPNVCNLFDVGEDRGVIYLVLEWVNGDSLQHVLRGGAATPAATALDYGIAARIVADACAGLHAAHELTDEHGQSLGVVHRDVSPHNLLVSLDGTTKIADFGVAKAQGQLHQVTRSGEIRGKLAYMSPEQLRGSTIDRRADIFAMGCVLYHATTGKPPFGRTCDAQTMRAVLDGAYEPPESVAADYPEELAAIITRALAACPDDRFATAHGMRVALEVWLARGNLTNANDVGAVVRQRIGAKLEQRRLELRAAVEAVEAEPTPDSTRPVLAAAARDSAVRRVEPPGNPAAAVEPVVGVQAAPLRLLPPGNSGGPQPSPTLPASQPPRPARRPLKMTLAVTMGLLTATAILQIRSHFVRPNVEPAPGVSLAAPPMPMAGAAAAVSLKVIDPAQSAALIAPDAPVHDHGPVVPAGPPRAAAISAPPAFPAGAAAHASPPARTATRAPAEIPANPY
jgi:hypothetical protein